MRVQFHGAAGEVTGSLHLVEAAGKPGSIKRVLLDCGMSQGSREQEASNVDPFPFDPASIDALVISHAHIDHIGRLPLLVKRGFRGTIWAQKATAELMPIMLMDSASLAESDAERFNRKRAHGEPEQLPLYTKDDVSAAIAQLRTLPYDTRTSILDGIEIAFRDAGRDAGPRGPLEDVAKSLGAPALADARQGRVVRQPIAQAKAGEPADCEVHLGLTHQPAVVHDAEQEPGEHQAHRRLWIYRRSPDSRSIHLGDLLMQSVALGFQLDTTELRETAQTQFEDVLGLRLGEVEH